MNPFRVQVCLYVTRRHSVTSWNMFLINEACMLQVSGECQVHNCDAQK